MISESLADTLFDSLKIIECEAKSIFAEQEISGVELGNIKLILREASWMGKFIAEALDRELCKQKGNYEIRRFRDRTEKSSYEEGQEEL